MKKTLSLIAIIGLVLALSSCKRTEIDDPTWDGPAGFYILLEGSANPAVLFIDGNIHRSTIYVRVTNNKGTPLAGATIFFEQLSSSTSHNQLDWGYFENDANTIKKLTNANGEASVVFYTPVEYHSGVMFIHAVMVVDDRAYPGSLSHLGTVPQDYIALAMYNSGGGAASTVK